MPKNENFELRAVHFYMILRCQLSVLEVLEVELSRFGLSMMYILAVLA